MLIDDIRQGEWAELELKRWLKTVVAFANCKGGRTGNSIRKMAEMLGIRKNTLDKQLTALKAKGVITRRNGTRGSWQVILSPRD